MQRSFINRGYLADYMQIMNACGPAQAMSDDAVYGQVHERVVATCEMDPGAGP